jgi:protein gp37
MSHRLASMADAAEARGEEPGDTAHYRGLTVLNNRGERHFNGTVRCLPDRLGVPMRWKKPRTVFVNSMSDLFHPSVPFEFIDRVFAVMAASPRHTFQVLTKRPERMAAYLSAFRVEPEIWREPSAYARAPKGAAMVERIEWVAASMLENGDEFHVNAWPLPNVHLGTSVEDQAAAETRIPELLKCPAVVRFLSCEPLLGPVDLKPAPVGQQPDLSCWLANREEWDDWKYWAHKGLLQWVIVGGESGGGARPCDVAWVRSIVEQCRDAGVPCFVKQLGRHPFTHDQMEARRWSGPKGCTPIRHDGGTFYALNITDTKGGDPAEWPADLRVREFPGAMGGSS